MTQLDMKKENCPCCKFTNYHVLYEGPIRSGSYGKFTNFNCKVMQCDKCGLARLAEFVVGKEKYESDLYRESYNDTSSVDALLSIHDHEQLARISIIGLDKFRGKVVLDYGSGPGSFLDSIRGVARETIAVEPFSDLHASLKKRGHKVYSYAENALRDNEEHVDIIVSFGVIEHVPDPRLYLEEAYKLLRPGGTIVLQTDNLDDVLMRTEAKDFKTFFYRTAHNWYFLPDTLKMIFESTGYAVQKVSTCHNYDFSNFVLWHSQGKPTGNGKLNLFNNIFDSQWKATVEAAGLGELITIVAKKSANEIRL